MLLNSNSIIVSYSCQQFQCEGMTITENEETETGVITWHRSTLCTDTVRCPYCGGKVDVSERASTMLLDMPIWLGLRQEAHVEYHRYKCRECRKKFSEEIGIKHPRARITTRLAVWIEAFLRLKMSIKAVQELTGVHWNTIKKLHMEMMEEKLEQRKRELKKSGYKPKHLAVDEFAIHKGHTYATCVIDLDEGDILWVGHGRGMDDFEKFFNEMEMEYLSDVEAVAMDMNASYNNLVEKHMPYAEIVYDRYHMQAQFGKDVLGVVRLNEARQHKKRADEITAVAANEQDAERKKAMKLDANNERTSYRVLKRARWSLLMNSSNLSEKKANSLDQILSAHCDLALCYAMKEEMCDLFELRDPEEAQNRWTAWFEAGKTSGIEPLVKFATLKEKRLKGLISHARYPISTGKLEGLNNKIKVSKRIGYGYRDDLYFFTLIRYLSLPEVRLSSPKVP